jgi:hypothetical protein
MQACQQQDNTPTCKPDRLGDRSGCARTVPEPTDNTNKLGITVICHD